MRIHDGCLFPFQPYSIFEKKLDIREQMVYSQGRIKQGTYVVAGDEYYHIETYRDTRSLLHIQLVWEYQLQTKRPE